MCKYDYLIVGAGLFGTVFAQQATANGKKVLLIEKRNHIGGNVYTEVIEDIIVHKYGSHVLHTSNKQVWEYITQFAEFNNFISSPVAVYNNEVYNLPFNMNTFSRLWGVVKPWEAQKIINQQSKEITNKPKNLEEQAISLVGRDIYEKLIKGYTEKQWGRSCKKLPTFIINRIPVRFTYDNNYFPDIYQGVPIGGYTKMIEKMLNGVDVELNTDYLTNKNYYDSLAEKIVYTGPIDAYFNYLYGQLEYRTVKYETTVLNIPNYQGNALVHYTSSSVPYSRIIEHKHFDFGNQPKTVISKEYNTEWKIGDEPYYPINDEKNNALYEKYSVLAMKENRVLFGGRLAEYKYYDMDDVILAALEKYKKEN